jgi:hypothetical protein
MDGRGTFLTIKEQAEGKAAVSTTKMKAYASIRDAHYKGERNNLGFQNYVQIQQDAHSDLELLKEPIPETKKVDDFLAGIIDPRLQNGKDNSIGDDEKLANFLLCQAFISSLSHKSLAKTVYS